MRRWCICYVKHTSYPDEADRLSFGTAVVEDARHPAAIVRAWDRRAQEISSGMAWQGRVAMLSFAEVGPDAELCDWET